MSEPENYSRVENQPSADHGDLPRRATSLSKHTPGPWRVSRSTLGSKLLIEAGDDDTLSPIVGSIYSDEGRLPVAANARLIAAAPEMLGALRAAELLLSDADLDDEPEEDEGRIALNLIRGAITKAEGQ